MEEKAISAMGEQQSSNKNFVGYILAFLLGAFVATIILYLTFSSDVYRNM